MTDVRLVASTTPGHKLVNALAGMTDVRLAASTHPNHMHARALAPADVTDVRLAVAARRAGTTAERALIPEKGEGYTTDVRLVGAAWDGANEQIATGLSARPGDARPAILVSYAYWNGFAKYRPRYAFRDYMLDSGAYSVHTSGATIDLPAYIDFCLAQLEQDPQLVEIIQLDVLHDWRQGQRNLQKMWDAGIPALPVWHWNEPEALLHEYAAAAPKVCVGVREKSQERKRFFYEQVFARVWPCRIHGLAIGGPALLKALPFHSADATNWILGPAGYGSYKSMGQPHRAPRGQGINLRAEVEWWLKLERDLKQQWAGALSEVNKARGPMPRRWQPSPASSPKS